MSDQSTDRFERLQAFHEEDPGDPFVRFGLAREYLKRDRFQKALSLFEALVQDHPGYTGTYYHLGKLYERLGRREKALETYQAGIEVCREEKATKDLSELQDALLQARGVGFE